MDLDKTQHASLPHVPLGGAETPAQPPDAPTVEADRTTPATAEAGPAGEAHSADVADIPADPDDVDSFINFIADADRSGDCTALSDLAVAIITETARDLSGSPPLHPKRLDGPVPMWKRRDMLTARKTRKKALKWVLESKYVVDEWDDSSCAYMFSLARCVALMNAEIVRKHGASARQFTVEAIREGLLHRPETVVKMVGLRANRPDEQESQGGGGSLVDQRTTPTHGLGTMVTQALAE